MTTPTITSGVLERVKPLTLRPHVVFRFESVLNAGNSITTPIFDTVGDGRPLTEVEVGGSSVIRVASRIFTLCVVINTTPGMRINCFQISDNGGQQSSNQLYVPLKDGGGDNYYRYECIGRRCQFRLVNSPLGTVAGAGSSTFFEVVCEG